MSLSETFPQGLLLHFHEPFLKRILALVQMSGAVVKRRSPRLTAAIETPIFTAEGESQVSFCPVLQPFLSPLLTESPEWLS